MDPGQHHGKSGCHGAPEAGTGLGGGGLPGGSMPKRKREHGGIIAVAVVFGDLRLRRGPFLPRILPPQGGNGTLLVGGPARGQDRPGLVCARIAAPDQGHHGPGAWARLRLRARARRRQHLGRPDLLHAVDQQDVSPIRRGPRVLHRVGPGCGNHRGLVGGRQRVCLPKHRGVGKGHCTARIPHPRQPRPARRGIPRRHERCHLGLPRWVWERAFAWRGILFGPDSVRNGHDTGWKKEPHRCVQQLHSRGHANVFPATGRCRYGRNHLQRRQRRDFE
mmetsp:Transcript_8706/g.25836  ORF Transcript_8706/g.25836 Transcript_8706/m.25836 type:complete len:277 (-) Transcript_8706:38-868(-)